jgi:hypothetical protein
MGRAAEGDLIGGDLGRPWLVVGWFTPDYRQWAKRLKASLDAVGAPHHLMACEKTARFWEAETRRKPSIVREFARAHPGKTLILLDADCTVRRGLEPLVASIKGDVAALVRAKPTGRGKERARIKVMSGTMVFRPTEGALHFIQAWELALSECDQHDVDQTALMIALGRATEFTFQPLGPEWCAFGVPAHPNPAIVHEQASLAAVHVRRPPPREVLRHLATRVREFVGGARGARSAAVGGQRAAGTPRREGPEAPAG